MLERGISILGLLTLVGIAWVFSRHRKAIKLRTVLWGMGLQLLFAVIILAGSTYSFSGMFLFVFLIVLYLFEEDFRRSSLGSWLIGAVAFAASAALVALFYFLTPLGVTPWILGLAAAVFAFGLWRGRRLLVHRGLIAVLLSGLGLLWARGIDGQEVFRVVSAKVAAFLALSNQGAEFLFGNLPRSEYFFPDSEFWPGFGVQFAFSVLPTIIFFSAFMGVMYHLGVVQVMIGAMARFMHWSLKTSGSETTSVSANIFVGQTEAPFLIKPFIDRMTVSELHAVMVGGFATIAGGVLAGYIQMGVDPGHLIAASVMSAPAALVIAKLLYPETEHSETAGDIEIPEIKTTDNLVGAAAAGTTDGLKLALNVGAMLIAFIALIAVVDTVFGYFDGLIDGRLLGGAVSVASGEYAGIFPGSLQTFFGTFLAPLAWLMGVPWVDAPAVGNLLGVKLAVNEFVAYGLLGQQLEELQPRSAIIATYALCGFANFASIGIQIGGIGSLAPERRADLSRVAVRAMFGGALASWTTATIAGILI